MREDTSEAAIRACLDRWDEGFRNADAELVSSLFSHDAEVMFDGMESIYGRDTVREILTASFAESDLTGYTADYYFIDILDRKACVIGNFDLPVYHYDGRTPTRTIGRAIWFFSLGGDGRWEITHAISARRGKTEPIAE